MPAVNTNIRKVPQLSQLDVKFCAPLWADQQVDTVEQLQNITNLYPHKLVWVRAESTWYYCKDPFGTKPDENGNPIRYPKWEKQDSRAHISVYNQNKEYIAGETVFLAGRIYNAITDILPGEAPTNTYDEPKWLCIAGETVSEHIPFENISSFTFITNITAPQFDVWVLEDESGIPEKVYPSITQIDDKNYKIEFWENRELAPKTGFINIK